MKKLLSFVIVTVVTITNTLCVQIIYSPQPTAGNVQPTLCTAQPVTRNAQPTAGKPQPGLCTPQRVACSA